MKYFYIALICMLCTVRAKANSSCREIIAPAFGVVNCSKGQDNGSVCTLSCETYYDLDGTTDKFITTECMENDEWSVSPWFTCSPIRCYPEQQPPVNGELICSATNLAKSLCVFYCNDHYDLDGIDTDKNAYIECVDDGDGDSVGKWTSVKDKPSPPTPIPTCSPIVCDDSYKAMTHGEKRCSAYDYSGSFCVFLCEEGYDLKGTTDSVLFTQCRRKDFTRYGQWSLDATPECRKCDRVRDIQLIAMIHVADGDTGHFALANRMVLRTATILERKYRSRTSLTVNTYSSTVDTTSQFHTDDFSNKRDKASMPSTLPASSGSGDDLGKALTHVKTTLDDKSSVRVAMIIANGFTIDENSEKIAQELIKDGVAIYVLGIPRNGGGAPSIDDMAKIAGKEKRVFKISNRKQIEDTKTTVTKDIAQVALEMGCDVPDT